MRVMFLANRFTSANRGQYLSEPLPVKAASGSIPQPLDTVRFSAKKSTTVLTKKFDRAVKYARILHADQRRKLDGEPYFTHLMGVSSIVLQYGGSEDEAIAALLHDAVEDQGGEKTRQSIARRFGKNVADIVAGCSDTHGNPGQAKPPWRKRKDAYIAHLATANDSVLLVSMSDKLYNSRDILSAYREKGEPLWGKFAGGKEGTLWYYQELVKAFQARGKHPELCRELASTVEQLTRMAQGA